MEELSETLKTGIEATYIDLEKLERASGVTKEAMPVSYTHLDVYKRQLMH